MEGLSNCDDPACGEDAGAVCLRWYPVERPPRTWGRRRLHPRQPRGAGQTPTRVGKTGSGTADGRSPATDPHARGEGRSSVSAKMCGAERPPRLGKTPGRSLRPRTPWKDPTRVGKASAGVGCGGFRGKDPHTRGEGPSGPASLKGYQVIFCLLGRSWLCGGVHPMTGTKLRPLLVGDGISALETIAKDAVV